MQRLVLYHAVHGTSHLYLSRRATRDAHARCARAREDPRTRARWSLLTDAAQIAI